MKRLQKQLKDIKKLTSDPKKMTKVLEELWKSSPKKRKKNLDELEEALQNLDSTMKKIGIKKPVKRTRKARP